MHSCIGEITAVGVWRLSFLWGQICILLSVLKSRSYLLPATWAERHNNNNKMRIKKYSHLSWRACKHQLFSKEKSITLTSISELKNNNVLNILFAVKKVISYSWTSCISQGYPGRLNDVNQQNEHFIISFHTISCELWQCNLTLPLGSQLCH